MCRFAYCPADATALTVSCFSKIQIGLTSLADLGSPGQRAVKRVCVCVCVLICYIFCFDNMFIGETAEDSEMRSERIQHDINTDDGIRPVRRKKSRSKQAAKSCASVENIDTNSIPDVTEDSAMCSEQANSNVHDPSTDDPHPPRVRPSRPKRTKSSKPKRATKLTEYMDVNCNPDVEPDCSVVKKSARRLADKLRTPLLQVFEAGDAEDFETGLKPPVEERGLETVLEPDGCGSTLHPVQVGIMADLAQSRSNAETHGKAEKLVDDSTLFHTGLASFDAESGSGEHGGRDVAMASRSRVQTLPTFRESRIEVEKPTDESTLFYDDLTSFDAESGSAKHCITDATTTSRSRVPTPPTFEETSAVLQAIEEAGRVSPVDVMGLVRQCKRGKTGPRQDAVDSDDELPSFNLGRKPCRTVLNGKTFDSSVGELAPGHIRNDLEFVAKNAPPSEVRFSRLAEKPSQEVVEASYQMDRRNRSAECKGSEDVLRKLADGGGCNQSGEDSDLPYAAADCNQLPVNTPSENPKSPSLCIAFGVPPVDSKKILGTDAKRKGAESLGFLPGEPQSTGKKHNAFSTAVQDVVSDQQNFNLVDDFLSFSDTNDDEFLAAVVATPVVQSRTDRHPVSDNSANVSVLKVDSQLTFTQALACVHDSINIRTGGPNVQDKLGKVDDGLETSVRIDEAQFDLGFEFSDDDNDDWDENVDKPAADAATDDSNIDDNSLDSDEDIIPPSPPASNSFKSSLRLGSRTNSLIAISRQNSCGSITASGRETTLPEDAQDVCSGSLQKSELVAEEADIRNALTFQRPNSAERLLSTKMVKSSRTLVHNAAKLGDSGLEKKSAAYLATLPTVEQKSLAALGGNESDAVATEEKSAYLPPLSQPDTEAVDKKCGFLAVETVKPGEQRLTDEYGRLDTAEVGQKLVQKSLQIVDTVATGEKSTDPARTNHVAVIRPSVRSLAMPRMPASQSQVILLPAAVPTTSARQSEVFISPPVAALYSSTPFRVDVGDKCGEFPFY